MKLERWLAGGLLLGTLLGPGTARAYRTLGDALEEPSSSAIVWRQDTVTLHIHGGAPGLVLPDTVDAIRAAMEEWNALECSDVRLQLAGATSDSALSGDGLNTIQWIEHSWTAMGFPSDAAAMTDIAFVVSEENEGHIVEADIYLNAEGHKWVAVGTPPNGSRDVESVLLHELGHVLGLEHPCEDDACSRLEERSVMHPIWAPSRAIGADDRAGACFLYPCENDSCGGLAAQTGASLPGSASSDLGEGPTEAALLGTFGDPCADDGACASDMCSEIGYCTVKCYDGDGCPRGSSCVDEASGEVCVTDAPFGVECAGAADCVSGVCLNEKGAGAVCSRHCSDLACPSGWECLGVDERRVCVPDKEADGGCSCRVPWHRSNRSATLAVLAAVLTCLRRRRVRRESDHGKMRWRPRGI